MVKTLINWAEKSENSKGYLHSAAVTKGSRVFGLGYNHEYIHAEGMALAASSGNARGATLWSLRVTRTGEMRLAKPCDRCMENARDLGIKKILYSTDGGMVEVRL